MMLILLQFCFNFAFNLSRYTEVISAHYGIKCLFFISLFAGFIGYHHHGLSQEEHLEAGMDCHPPPFLCTGLRANQVYTGMVT